MALVLSRKPGESIDIGNATIEIISVAGNRVRLAIQAPPDVRVLRSELAGKDSPDGETSESGDPGTGRFFRASAGSGDRGTNETGDGFGELDGDLCDE
jgi:carbon storage regulator CsrA